MTMVMMMMMMEVAAGEGAAAKGPEMATYIGVGFGAASLLKDSILLGRWAWVRWGRPALARRAARRAAKKEKSEGKKKDEEDVSGGVETEGVFVRFRQAQQHANKLRGDLQTAEEEVERLRSLVSAATQAQCDNAVAKATAAGDAATRAAAVVASANAASAAGPVVGSAPGPSGPRNRVTSGQGDAGRQDA